jgi:hypothetical protein
MKMSPMLITYDPPMNCLATWVCLITDIDWYRNIDQSEIHRLMSLQFDIEEQHDDPINVTIRDDIVMNKIIPVSPVILSKLWNPELFFDLTVDDPLVKHAPKRFPRLTHLVKKPLQWQRPASIWDKRIKEILSKTWEKHSDEAVILLHHAVGWGYSTDNELLAKNQKPMKTLGYVNTKRLIGAKERLRQIFGIQ